MKPRGLDPGQDIEILTSAMESALSLKLELISFMYEDVIGLLKRDECLFEERSLKLQVAQIQRILGFPVRKDPPRRNSGQDEANRSEARDQSAMHTSDNERLTKSLLRKPGIGSCQTLPSAALFAAHRSLLEL